MIENYKLELDKAIKTINKEKVKRVLLQFPDGLKPYALKIVDEIKAKTKAEIFIWLDSCYGACDIPLEAERAGIDLIIQFGHSKWNFNSKDIKILN